jgi:hypothetical protein
VKSENQALWDSYSRALRARHRSPETIASYLKVVHELDRRSKAELAELSKEDIETEQALVLAVGTYSDDVDDVYKVLLGGLVTLLVTVAVQFYVTPRVQRKTRELERWEKNAAELMTLVNEDLVEKLAALDQELGVAFGGSPDAEEYDKKFWATYGDVRNILTKITQRVRRCSVVSPRFAYWADLVNRQQRAWDELRALNTEINTGRLDMQAGLGKLHESNDQLSEVLRVITEPVKPPKQPPWWQTLTARLRLNREVTAK